MTAGLKTGVEACVADGSCVTAGAILVPALTTGDNGTGDLPAPPAATNNVLSVSIATNGTITGKATALGGLNGETYIMVPTLLNGAVTWDTSTGTCKTRAAGAIC